MSTQLYIHAAGNELLNYLKGLEAESVSQLTAISDDSVEAVNSFIQRLLGEPFSHACAATCLHSPFLFTALLCELKPACLHTSGLLPAHDLPCVSLHHSKLS